jgi:hemoglobin
MSLHARRLLASTLRCVLLVGLATAAQAGATLYERMGGEPKMRATVEEFVAVLLADDRLNFAFADTDLGKFKQLLFEQFCALADGPCKYTGRDMHESHAKLNIKDAQFNALAEDLYVAFDRTHVPYRLQNKLMALLAPMEKDIVKKEVPPGTQLPPPSVR